MVRALCVYPCLFAAALGLAPVVPPRPELPLAVASMLEGASFGTMKTSMASVSSSADRSPSLRGQPPTPLPMTLARTGMIKAQWVEALSKSQGFSQALPEANVWSTVAQQATAARFTTETFSHAATASASSWIISVLLLVPVSAAGLWWQRRALTLRGKNSQTEMTASNSVVWPQQPSFAVAAFCGESVDVGPPPLRSPARPSTNISFAAPHVQHLSLPIAASRHDAVRANGSAAGPRCGLAAGKAAATATATGSGPRIAWPASIKEIQEPCALDLVKRYELMELSLPEWLADRPVQAAFVGPGQELEAKAGAAGQAPLLLLHGFDSSGLEYRRLLPELEAAGVAVYLLDLLGWGFGDTTGVRDFSPSAKRAHLHAFWKQKFNGRPVVLGGGSLGGGIAMDFAVAHPEAVERLVLFNPQGFIDGAPALGPLAPLGIYLLGSWPVRWLANQLGYADKEKFATEDAIRIGRLHVDMDGWERASLHYLNSGGYTLSPLVSQVRAPTLLLWGEKDEILNLDEQAPRFLDELRCAVQVEWIRDSGHVPHLEKPASAAKAIVGFMQKPESELVIPKLAPKQPPAPSTLQVIAGFATNIFPWIYMLQLRREGYTDVAEIRLSPGNEFIFLMSAQAVREVAVDKASIFARRVTVPLFETLELDKGIVYEQGERHLRNKKLCIPSFEGKQALISFYTGIQAEFEALRERWTTLCALNGGKAEIDLYAEMRKFTLDIVLRVTFGLGDAADSYDRADELSDTIKEYLERIVATANEVPPVYTVAPFLSSNYNAVVHRLLPQLRELVDDIIDKRRNAMNFESEAAQDGAGAVARSRADLLSVLIADKTISNTEISRILFDIIIAGSDTTASSLAAALYVLHEPRHRDVQLDRARREASKVDASSLPLDELKSGLPYMNAVTREILRLYPPVPFFGRTSVADAVVCGYAIKKNSTACFSPWYMGRDKFAWGDTAEEFVPERWLNSTTGGAPSAGQWLPFGVGMRGCLGTRLAVTEAVIGLARLLREFDFTFESDGELQFSYDITLNLEGTTMCSVSPRK